MPNENKHHFSFFKAGGSDHVHFRSGADYARIDELDFKLWAALSCPTRGLAFDNRTLELIDSNGDSRVRAPELIAAVKWAVALLRDPESLLKGSAELPLSAIDDGNEDGAVILSAARMILKSLGKEDASVLSMTEMSAATAAFDALPFNGDGVVTPASARSDDERQLIGEVLDCVGGVPDRSGALGVDAVKTEEFFALVRAHVTWLDKGAALADPLPLGDQTAAAAACLQMIRSRVDDYFLRCRLAEYDEQAVAALNTEVHSYTALATMELHNGTEAIRAMPLSKIGAGKPLSLSEGVNPAWREAVAQLQALAVTPILGNRSALTEAEWRVVQERLAPWESWQKEKAGTVVEKLGTERIRELAAPASGAVMERLFAEEKSQEQTAQGIAKVEKLVRFHRDLHRLVDNFVSFREFFLRKNPAIFQVGRLFLDQRECHLCIRVEDVARHALMAHLSRMQLAYCECVRAESGEKMTIAAAFTAGDSDNLMVGRNGVFFDGEGRDWDATITRLVDNPISIRQAFWSPYKKLIRFIEDQVAKRANEGDAKANERLTGGVAGIEGAVGTTPPAAAVAPPAKKLDIGIVAALGVAVGGITAALGVLTQAFFGLGLWMPIGVLGLLLAISGPSMLIAWLKLRQRNLGPLLDANGWAVNSRARINIPLGASLTKVATLPGGAALNRTDPFAQRRIPWTLIFFLALVAVLAGLWFFNRLDPILPQALKHQQGIVIPALFRQ